MLGWEAFEMLDAVRNGNPKQQRSPLGAQVLLAGKQQHGGGEGERVTLGWPRGGCRAGVAQRRREDGGMQGRW